MAVIDTLPRASFADIPFPFEKRTIEGSGRQFTFVFPHSPGGENEKMGRELYRVIFSGCQFHDRPDDDMARFYPDLYPNGLAKLRLLFELQITKPLVVPGLGTIPAFCTNWTQVLDTRIASGEDVTLNFLEDQDARDVTKVSAGRTGKALEQASLPMFVPTPELPETPSVFQQINDFITSIQAIEGQRDAAANILAGKLAGIVQLCGSATASLKELGDPLNHQAFTALKEVWLLAQTWADDLNATSTPIGTWTTPKKMKLNEISIALYGDATHVDEIITLNPPFPDPFEVRAGTPIRFYQV